MNNNGRQGEELFRQYMEQQGYAVEDVSDNPAYWSKDIDMLITSPTTGVTKAFEVKWDTKIHKTANLFLEIVSKYSAGMHGWYEFCEADFLIYGDAVNKIFYVFDMEVLRAEVDKMPKELANCGSDSIGYLVPLRRLKELYGVIKI